MTSLAAIGRSSHKTTHPVLPETFVRRPRITELLGRSTGRPVTIVCAGPGSGKTLSVAAWADSVTAAVAWLSLDQTDNDPGTFWDDVLSAVRTVADLDQTGLEEVSPAASFGLRDVRRLALGLSRLPRPVVLVLDDLHEVSQRDVLNGLDQFVANLPETMRLVIVTRVEPPIRLQRLRLRDLVSQVDGRDLAFDEEEAARFFGRHGVQLDAGQRGLLLSRTEGWAAGLRLATLSMTTDEVDVDDAVQQFAGDERSVYDYLLSEVLDQLPEDVRRLLLQTSVLDQVCGSLADAVTGRDDGQAELERLTRENVLVVSLDRRMQWFRYHPLLRDVLLHELDAERTEVRHALHERATAWFREQGLVIDALQHACAAHDWPLARRMLVQDALYLLLSPRRAALAAALRPAIEGSATDVTFDQLLIRAAVAMVDRDFTGMARAAAAAVPRLDEVEAEGREMTTVAVRLFEMAAARLAGEAETSVRLATEVRAFLATSDIGSSPVGRQYDVIAGNNEGSALVWLGRFDDARVQLDRAHGEAQQLGLALPSVNAASHLAALDALQGSLSAASATARDVLELAERRGWEREPQVLACYLALGIVGLQRDELAAGEAQLRRGLEVSQGGTDRALRLAVQIALVHVSLSRGDRVASRLGCAQLRRTVTTEGSPAALTDWLAAAERELLLLEGDPARLLAAAAGAVRQSAPSATLDRARAHLALGQRDLAERLITPLVDDPVPDPVVVTGAWAIAALLADARRDDAAAVHALNQALGWAEPERLRRPLRLVSTSLVSLLGRHRAVLGDHSWLGWDDAQAPPSPGLPRGPLAETLTERERAVLTYLPTMLTNEEIADALLVSVNTVKAHLKAVYRKLGVTARRDAVRRARDLGLLA